MRVIADSYLITKCYAGVEVKGPHTRARLAVHLKGVLDRFEHTNGHLPGINIETSPSNQLIAGEQQSTLKASGIEYSTVTNYIP